MLFVTQKAAEMIALSAQASGSAGDPLRVSATAAKGGGAPRFRMGFDQRRAGDALWECNGVAVVVDAASQPLLENVILDFQDLPGGGPQFTFIARKDGEE